MLLRGASAISVKWISQGQEKLKPGLSIPTIVSWRDAISRCPKWNSRDTIPIRPATNQVLCPQNTLSMFFTAKEGGLCCAPNCVAHSWLVCEILTSDQKLFIMLFKTTMINLSNYINTREAAKRLGIHEESLRRIIRIGTLPAEKIGGQWYIEKDKFNIFKASYNAKSGRRKSMIWIAGLPILSKA